MSDIGTTTSSSIGTSVPAQRPAPPAPGKSNASDRAVKVPGGTAPSNPTSKTAPGATGPSNPTSKTASGAAPTNPTSKTAPGAAPTDPTSKTAPSATSTTKPIETLQYAWFAGHAFTVVGTAIEIVAYSLFQGHRTWSQIIYRATFAVIVATYVLSLHKKLKGQIPTFFALLPLESFQYGSLAVLWLISTGHLLKLIPFFVYSALQAGHFASTRLIPGTENAQKIDSLLLGNAQKLEKFVSWNNVLLTLRLILDCLLIRRGSFVSILVYGFFLRLRFEYSPTTSETLHELEEHADKLLTNEKVPAKVQETWKNIKWNIDHYQTHDLKKVKKAPPPVEKPLQTRPRQPSDSRLFLDEKK